MGRQLGAYRLEGLIGSGAFGSVYRARHVHLGVLRAVKVLQPGFAQMPELRARFLREGRTAAALSHPSIVPVHDFGIDDGVQYIVMEFVEAVTLAEHVDALEPGRRLTDPTVLDCVGDIAAALDYAHARGVLHRDLKPANVLVRRSDGRAMLTDFGVARVLSESGLTQTGLTIGSYAYMSPEQCAGVGSGLTPRADVYAFAAVLYEIASGSPPFGRGLAAVGGHLHQPVPRLRPAALDTALRRGLAKRPEERPDTAGALAASYLAAVAPPAAAPSAARPVIVRHGPPWFVRAAAAAIAIGLAGTFAATHGWAPTLPWRPPAPVPSQFPTDFPIRDPQHAVRGTAGRPIEVRDRLVHAEVTVVAANLNAPDGAGIALGDPRAYRFVAVSVHVKNLSSGPLEFGAYDWWLSDSTGYPYPERPAPATPRLPTETTDLAPGGAAEGYVAFEVPRSATGLEVWMVVGESAVRVPLG